MKFFGFKPQIPISLKLGLVRDDNDLCQSEFCQSLPNHTHVNKETSLSCIDNLLSPENSMDLLNRETQFKNIYRNVYRKVREANHRSLSYRNKCKLAKPLRVGQNVLLENRNVPFELTESQGIDPNVFPSSGNAPLYSIVSTHGNAPSTSSAFWNNSIDGNAPNTSNNGNAPNNNGNAPLPPP